MTQYNSRLEEIVRNVRTILVWRKGVVVPGFDSEVWRKDSEGWWIKRTDYGEVGTYGWEIDHIIPSARGGGDQLDNLQPLHWQANRRKSDSLAALIALLTKR
jgi:5-methylcytosine-specific restriction endonuclease McrA